MSMLLLELLKHTPVTLRSNYDMNLMIKNEGRILGLRVVLEQDHH